MGKIFRILLMLIPVLFMGFVLKAQTRVLKGKVVSADGPLVGASILIKGTTTGTASGSDGSFTLNVPERDVTLVVTSIGYAKAERSVGQNETNVDVTLVKDNSGLSEIVVTALGITRQSKTLPYATQTVKVGSLTEVRDPNNVLNSLQGKVANAVITQGSGGPGSAGAWPGPAGGRHVREPHQLPSAGAWGGRRHFQRHQVPQRPQRRDRRRRGRHQLFY